ncbi:MAG: DUF4340 domain-containing protein [Planctomycetota bacterium]|nr:DUF4340 domain-containing protein [Planctomycetota bacterium]
MRSRLVTVLILALLALFLFKFAAEEDLASVPPPTGGVLFPGLETADVDFISMKFRTQHVLDIQREPQGPWLITHPTDELAQKEYVEVVVRNLANAKVLPVGEQGAEIDGEKVGLGKRAKSITFGRGPARTTILIGDRNPVGPGVFARMQGSPHVLMVTENLDTMLEHFRAQDYVDKHLLRGLEGYVRKVRIESPDGVLVDAVLDGDGWTLTEPALARADNGRLSTLVRSLRFVEQIYPIDLDPVGSELRKLGFPTAEQVAAGDWAESTVIELSAAGQEPSRVFIMKDWEESPDANIFAIRDDLRKVLVIDRRELNLLLNKPEFFRDRRVLPPIRDRARRVRIDVGDDVLLDVAQDRQGRWIYSAPDHLRGLSLDSQRVNGFSLASEFLGALDDLRVEGFDDAVVSSEQTEEPLAVIRVDWDWAGSERVDKISIYDLAGGAIRARVTGRPTEGLLLNPDVLDLLTPDLPDRLRNLTPVDVAVDDWGGLDIFLPEFEEPLHVDRPGPKSSWVGDDEWGRRFGLGLDLQRGFRGLRWQPASEPYDAANYPWRVVYRDFSGGELGTLSFRTVRPHEASDMLGKPVVVAHWSGVDQMELFVDASVLERVVALSGPQGRED